MTNEEMTEHRVLAAIRAMQIEKHADVVAAVEGMAKAFPKPIIPPDEKPQSLRLVASSGTLVGVGQRPSHDQQGVLTAVGLGAVSAK